MIGKNEFIDAIGEPDEGFRRSVDDALNIVRARAAREEARRPRRYHMILPVAAAAAIFVVFMGVALRGGFSPKTDGGKRGGVMAQPEITMLKKPEETAAAEADTVTTQPILEAEIPYNTEEPNAEEPAVTAYATPEPTRGPEEWDAAASDGEPAPTYTPAPEEAQAYDLYDGNVIDKIVSQFDGNISALYAGYELGRVSYESVGGGECAARWISSDINGEMAVEWITIGAPEFLPDDLAEARAGREYYTVSIDVPENADAIARFVSTADDTKRYIYESSLMRIEDAFGGDVADADLMLTGMRFYLDSDLAIRYCEMYFSGDEQTYLLWEYVYNDKVGYTLLMDLYGGAWFENIFEDPDMDSVNGSEETEQDVIYDVLPETVIEIGKSLGLPGIGIIGGADEPMNTPSSTENPLDIIGGADGPTQVVVGGIITDTVAMPETYYALFCEGLGQDISELWPGAYLAGSMNGTGEARGSEYPCEYWLMSDGTSTFAPAWVTWGEVVETDAGEPMYDCPTMSVVMPDDPEQIDTFMLNAAQWLYDVYFDSRNLVCEMCGDPSGMYNGWELAGMKITFDSGYNVNMCELFFGNDDIIYLLWTRNGDGFELTNDYVDESGEFFGEYFGLPGSDGLPEDKLMFMYAFGVDVSVLYPDNDGLYIEGDGEHSSVYVKYNTVEEDRASSTSCHAWDVSRGGSWVADGHDAHVTVSAYMPDDAVRTDEFMLSTWDWLLQLYLEANDETGLQPTTVSVTFSEDGDACGCEMIFGSDNGYYQRWIYDGSGEFITVETGGFETLE